MKKNTVTDRLTFLAKSFDVFECSEEGVLKIKLEKLKSEGYTPFVVSTQTNKGVKNSKGDVLGIVSVKNNTKERTLKQISICSDVFSAMIASDPSENKMYLQWMLNVFSRLIKGENKQDIDSAIRFVKEDLPQAKAYLILFEENKRKNKFKMLAKNSYTLKNVLDPTNINQYKSLSQLFDAVDPFIEKEPSAVERTMQKFVDSGQAEIPVKDRKFTLYIPKTTAASVIFENFANWCTAKEGNGMFNSYTSGNKKPNNKNSDIYIIVNNEFFKGESQEMYQIHFETKQIKDRLNSGNVSIYDSVLSKSEGLTNYFKEELLDMAKAHKKGIEKNNYLDYLIKFGFAESLFELLDKDTNAIRFMTREIPRLPDMTKFKELDQLVVTKAKLSEVHPSIGTLTKLQMVAFTDNNLKTLPKEIGNLKNLVFLNLTDNPIESIPNEISYLDKSNGGSLLRLGISKDVVGDEIYRKLKELLPTTLIN